MDQYISMCLSCLWIYRIRIYHENNNLILNIPTDVIDYTINVMK